jgi:hypothetical protein
MGVRESLKEKPWVGIAVGALMVAIAGVVIARAYWPTKQADLSKQLYSDDDGKTWFADSLYLVPPFERNGKTVAVAHVYSYAGGSKRFCAYLAKFTPEAKQKLEAAIGDARQRGLPPSSVSLYGDRNFMNNGVLVKKPGADKWVIYSDPAANEVMAVKSPDGSEVDEVLVF